MTCGDSRSGPRSLTARTPSARNSSATAPGRGEYTVGVCPRRTSSNARSRVNVSVPLRAESDRFVISTRKGVTPAPVYVDYGDTLASGWSSNLDERRSIAEGPRPFNPAFNRYPRARYNARMADTPSELLNLVRRGHAYSPRG